MLVSNIAYTKLFSFESTKQKKKIINTFLKQKLCIILFVADTMLFYEVLHLKHLILIVIFLSYKM